MKINKQRIKFLIKKQSLKQMDVARKIDVTPQDFTNWMFRGIFPHYDKLKELATVLEVDVDSLYEQNDFNEPQGIYNKRINLAIEDLVPYYELDAKSGLSLLWKDDLSDNKPKDHIYIPGMAADLILPYYGKNMKPQLENGDLMALRRIKDFGFLNYGAIHVIVTKEQVIVRQVNKTNTANSLDLSTLENNTTAPLSIKTIKALYAIVTVIKRNTI